MKTSTILITLFLFTAITHAQNPKKTHDHHVFGERVTQALFTDLSSPIYSNARIKLTDALAGRNSILGYLMNNKTIEANSAVLGKSVDELKQSRKKRKKELEYELTLLKMRYSNGIINWDKAQLVKIQLEEKSNEKIPIADIILDVKEGNKSLQIVLANCMQTSEEWVLGDFVGVVGSRELIDKDSEMAKQQLSNLTSSEYNENVLTKFGRWRAYKAIVSYDNYPEKGIVEEDQLRWTVLKKLDFTLLNNGKLSSGVYLEEKNGFKMYSTKWSLRKKSRTILFASDQEGVYATKIVEIKSLADREMVLEYKDLDATTTYFLSYSTPGRQELSVSEFNQSQWNQLIISKSDLIENANSSKNIDIVYQGLAIFKTGKIEEINLKYQNQLTLSNIKDPLLLYGDEYIEKEKTDDSAISFIDKNELQAFVIGDQLWLPKTIKNKTKWALMFVQGPLSSFIIYEKPTASKMGGIGNPGGATDNPDENRKLFLQKFGEETMQNILIGFRKKAANLVADNKELSSKISAKEKGYGASSQDSIAAEYNQWFKESNPDQYSQYFILIKE